MYRKPIKNLSARQKRNLRQQISRSIDNKSSRINETSINIEGQHQERSVENGSVSNCEPNSLSKTLSAQVLVDTPRTHLPNFHNSDDYIISDSSDDTDSQCSCSECTNSFDVNIRKFHEDLKNWAVECNVPLSHTSKLLQILNKHNLNVPSDARTLLNTPRNVELKQVEPGVYCHIGLKSAILKDLDTLPDDIEAPPLLKININIDGLPLSKSSGSQFWPILGWFVSNTFHKFHFKPFVIGIYHGHRKPCSANDLLKYFIDEFEDLKVTGVLWRGLKINIEFNALICDAPAKSFVTYTKGHTGYHGCNKCIQEGDYFTNRMTFPELGCPLRTDESFKNKLDEDHHVGTSNLENLGIGMVSQVPLDYMHLVCLGVMKRLLQFWHKGRHDVRIPANNFSQLNDFFMSYKYFVPKDFSRKPRTLHDIDRYKATEFRQILLYTGVVSFKDFLPENMYSNFLCLSCAIRILVSPSLCFNLNNSAQEFLNEFILDYAHIYGREYVTYNVHNLSHLPKDVLRFGCLDNFSAFAPESYMYHLKKKICIRSSKPLQQIFKRLKEETRKYESFKTELEIKENCYKLRINNGAILTNQSPDNYCLLKNGTFVSISEIWKNNNELFIKGYIIKSKGNFFEEPIDSRALGIHLCTLSNDSITYNVVEVISKVFILPYKENWVAFPL